MSRRKTPQAIQQAGNPSLARHMRAQAVEQALAERALRRAQQATVPTFMFDQDQQATNSSRSLHIKISREYEGFDEVVKDNDGNHVIIFREWRYATTSEPIARFLRWAIKKRGLNQVKEVVNPKIKCGVDGCDWSGTVMELNKHFMDNHVDHDEDAPAED